MLDDAIKVPRTDSRPPVALIAGPTASGKSALALALAEARNGIIINADASQVYADLEILSARPNAKEMARLPHRLFGYLDGASACSAAGWAAEAIREIDAAHAAGSLPIIVGGTGLYIRTLLDGIAPIPEIDLGIRGDIRAMTREDIYAALSREDPEAAMRLAPADIARASRALEVIRSTGTSIDRWRERREGGIADRIALAPVILLPPRDWLYARCDRRFAFMLEAGGIEEVERLIARNLSPDLPVMRAIGVPEIRDWLVGDIDRDTMIAQASAATRQYAKRQYTWFRRQPPADWHREAAIIDDNNIDLMVTLFQH